MSRQVTVVLLLSLLWLTTACAGAQALADPPVVAPSMTASPEAAATPTLEPSPIVAVATSTVMPSPTSVPPTPVPATPTPQPTVTSLPVERSTPATITVSSETIPESWSPSGRYFIYAVPLGGEIEQGGLERAQHYLFDTQSNQECAVRSSGERDYFLPTLLWLSGDRLLFVGDDAELKLLDGGCEGEPAPIDGEAPRFLRGVAATDNYARWLILSEDDLWLFDGATARFQAVEGLSYGSHPGASWSPNGNHVLLVQEGNAFRIDPSSGQVTELAAWDYQPGPGTENFPGPPPYWIDNERFLVPSVPLGGPQLIGLDGSRRDVSVELFGLEPVAEEGFSRAAILLTDEGEGWHILLASFRDGRGLQYQLYHSETESVEQLDLPSDTGNFNFVGLVDGGRQMFFNELGTSEMALYWLRPLHPLGSPWATLVEGSFRATISPDSQLIALSDATGVTVYHVDGRPLASWEIGTEAAWLLWSPTGDRLAATTMVEGEQRLYLLDLTQP